MSHNEEDLALSRRAATGDRSAYGMLVAKHEAPLRAFLGKFVQSDAADDIAQEAFLKAWRSAAHYDGRARYSTWLTAIAWRCHLDFLRKERAMRGAETLEPSEETESSEGSVQITDILARLPPIERAALMLCEGHGWSHAETAKLLRMPLGTLKSTVARAKAKCRELWIREPQ